MTIENERVLSIPIEDLWSKLLDSKFLASITPGLQDVREVGEDSYETTSEIKIGFFKKKITAAVQVAEKKFPTNLTYKISQDSNIGDAEISLNFSLEEVDVVKTRIRYRADAEFSGLLATMGNRIGSELAENVANRFFQIVEDEYHSPSSRSSDTE